MPAVSFPKAPCTASECTPHGHACARTVGGPGLRGLARRRPLDRRTVSLAFTHSPVFHPLTYRGFDGLAWQTHWFMRANDTAMACAALVLLTRRHR